MTIHAALDFRDFGRVYLDHALMKQPEYTEGPEALKNFEQGMIALFKVPKAAIGKARKKGRKPTAPRKRKRADED